MFNREPSESFVPPVSGGPGDQGDVATAAVSHPVLGMGAQIWEHEGLENQGTALGLDLKSLLRSGCLRFTLTAGLACLRVAYSGSIGKVYREGRM